MSKLFYDDLYYYISTGGQGLVLTCKGSKYSFRVPNPEDYSRSLNYSDVGSDQEDFLLAVCLESIAGFEIPQSLNYSFLKEIKACPKIKRRIMPHFWKVVEKHSELSTFFEAFCYTSTSRYLWRRWNHSIKFGFKMPYKNELSEIHMQWISFNEVEDRKEQVEDAWSRTFFEASAMNPKGVKKVQKDWEQRRDKEEKYREEVLKKAEQGIAIQREDAESKITEDMQKEYYNWVEGVEDEHDIKIREYKEKLNEFLRNGRKFVSNQESQYQEMKDNLNSLSMVSPLRAFSDTEIDQIVKSKKAVQVNEGEEYDMLLSNKYLNARELVKSENTSLMDKVSNRKLPTI
jgi:hypothetical protein